MSHRSRFRQGSSRAESLNEDIAALDRFRAVVIIWSHNQITMARPSNHVERRAQIVQALLEVMATSGYDGATVSSIAEAAGLAPGLVHYHFENKQEILLALGEELVRRVRARSAARASSAKDDWERLFAFTDAHVALGRDADPYAAAAWVVLGAEALRQPEVRRLYQRATRDNLAELEGLLRPLLASEGCAPSQAPDIAATLLSTIEGAYQLGVVARAAPRGFAAPMLRELALGLVRSSKTRGARRA